MSSEISQAPMPSAPESTGDTSSTTQEPEETVASTQTLTAEVFCDPDSLAAALETARAEGVQAILLELKGYDGLVRYQSQLETVQRIGAVSADAVDLAAVISQVRAAGFSCAAQIACFDECYTATQLREAAVKYGDGGSARWLDYTRASRTAWLDPGLPAAQQYNLELIGEICSYEVDAVYLTGVHYPVWGDLSNCYFAGEATKEQVITQFISTAREQVNAAGKKLAVVVPASGAVGDYHAYYANYGFPQDVFTLPADLVVVDLRLDNILNDWYTQMHIGVQTFENFTSDPLTYAALLADAVHAAYAAQPRDCALSVMLDDIGAVTAAQQAAQAQSVGVESFVLSPAQPVR